MSKDKKQKDVKDEKVETEVPETENAETEPVEEVKETELETARREASEYKDLALRRLHYTFVESGIEVFADCVDGRYSVLFKDVHKLLFHNTYAAFRFFVRHHFFGAVEWIDCGKDLQNNFGKRPVTHVFCQILIITTDIFLNFSAEI